MSLTFQPMMESRPIREIAYEVLKKAIITGEIPAGERIVETDYADRLHISRTPLREALRKLERDGLVEYVMRRGVIVHAFTTEDVEQIYTIRNCLEMLTLPDIIEKATPEDIAHLRELLAKMDELNAKNDVEALSPVAREFHTAITAISGKNRILRVIEGQDEYIRRFSAMAIKQEDRRNDANEEHHRLVDLIEQKNLPAFEALMKQHIERSKECCLAALAARKQNRELDPKKSLHFNALCDTISGLIQEEVCSYGNCCFYRADHRGTFYDRDRSAAVFE